MNKYLFLDFDGTVRETVADPTIKNPNDRRPPFKKEEVKFTDNIGIKYINIKKKLKG